MTNKTQPHVNSTFIWVILTLAIAAGPLFMHADSLQKQLDESRSMEEAASEAWSNCAADMDREYEYRADERLERTVREQVESVFWPCGRPPLPDGYCEEGRPNPRDVLDAENYDLHPDSCTADCKYCALEKAAGNGAP